MSDWDVLDRQFDAVGQPNDPKSFYKINTLRDLIDNLNERLTALETARATAPASDDEIVEALAKATFEREVPPGKTWRGGVDPQPWINVARLHFEFIKRAGYDVVKRS